MILKTDSCVMSFSFCGGLDKATDEMQCALLPRNAGRKKRDKATVPHRRRRGLRSAKRRRRPCDTSLADGDLVGLQPCSMCWDGMEMLQWKFEGISEFSCRSFGLVHILDRPSHFEAFP